MTDASQLGAADIVLSPTPALPADSVYTSCYCEENIYLLAQTFSRLPGWDAHAIFISNASKSVALWNQKAAREPASPVFWDYHVVLALRARGGGSTRPRRDPGDITANGALSPGVPHGDDAARGPGRESAMGETWIYDFDSVLCDNAPRAWEAYVAGTFSPALTLAPEYQSVFRVVPAADFLDHFASDRSHMLLANRLAGGAHVATAGMGYISPPPAYPALCGRLARERGVATNLMAAFVRMPRPDAPAAEGEEAYGEIFDLGGFARWCARG